VTDYTIYKGDVLEAMQGMPDDSFDCILTDAPYGISFMGREWDHGVPGPDVWAEALRVVKPGGHLLAFGGTRMWHWLAVGIEQGGWEIRDTIMWLYAQGFPKAHDISKAIDSHEGAEREVVGKGENFGASKMHDGKVGYGDYAGEWDITAPATPDAKRFDGYKSATKPSWEPVVVAMAPLDGTYAENAIKHGVAGLNVDGGRIGTEEVSTNPRQSHNESGRTIGDAWHGNVDTSPRRGRYPANLILDAESARLLDEQSGDMRARGNVSPTKQDGGFWGSCDSGSEYRAFSGDSGGASRFFYNVSDDTEPMRFKYEPKASRSEREAGLFDRQPDTTDDGRDTPIDNAYQRGKTERQNTHPTVKPVDLARYLATLILPPERDTERKLLIPYSGSGSEMIGAMLAGWDHITGIEMNAEYIDIATTRLAWWDKHGEDAIDADKAERKRREHNDRTGQVDLIDALGETE
jgi:site-specific DNA-methyltransferase (adenine-specific)